MRKKVFSISLDDLCRQFRHRKGTQKNSYSDTDSFDLAEGSLDLFLKTFVGVFRANDAVDEPVNHPLS